MAAVMAVSVMAMATCGLLTATTAAADPGTAQSTAQGTAGTPQGTQSQIDAAQAQAQALASQIEAQQQQVSQLSEQYDRASVALAGAQAALVQTTAQLADDQQHEAVARQQLQSDAVNAYVYDEPLEGLDSLFSSASEKAALHDEYQSTAIGNISAAVQALVSSERQLAQTEAAQKSAASQAATQQAALQQSEQAARSAAQASQSTLNQVQGQIAQLIAQQAAQRAAAEAAAAAAAASQAAKEQAAAAAAAAAQVAQTVDAGSQDAGAAAAAANLAAIDAGSGMVIGDGQVVTASGPGAMALHEAEKYLGVPYVWGGASMSGVDCSGLVMLAWQAAGVSLLHSAALEYLESTPVPTNAVQPGDLLFYDLDGTGIDHVVMYVGSGLYGSATIIQAAHTGTVVEFDPDWTYGLVGAGRP